MSSPTIKDFYQRKSKAGDVGIEVEVEFPLDQIPPHSPGGAWKHDHDESLQNGMEYITRQPIKVEGKLEKIKFLTDGIAHAKPYEGRGSIHVHRNILDFTPIEVWNTIIAYWLLEKPLTAFCGEKRKGYVFCLGLTEANQIIQTCLKDLKNVEAPFSSFQEQQCKYGAQNLSCIARLGSIEYRTMRGTVDPGLIDLWSTTVYHLGEKARLFKDPGKLMDFYIESPKDMFLRTLLPEAFMEYLVKDTNNYESLIRKSALHCADVAYFHDDWQAWQAKLKVPEKIERPRDDIDEMVDAFARGGLVAPGVFDANMIGRAFHRLNANGMIERVEVGPNGEIR